MRAGKNGRGPMAYEAQPTTAAPLGHPLRARILQITNERDISPRGFVDEGLQQSGVHFDNRQHALSHVSYHFRELEKAGCVEVIRTVQRRGATEHIYRGTLYGRFTSEEFAKLPKERRRTLSRTGMQALIARVEGAMHEDTFDARTNRFMVMTPLELDERGWGEFIDTLDNCFAEVERINDDCKDRLANSGEKVIPATYGMLGFESPPPPPLPNPDR
jgi:hypothetical protein